MGDKPVKIRAGDPDNLIDSARSLPEKALALNANISAEGNTMGKSNPGKNLNDLGDSKPKKNGAFQISKELPVEIPAGRSSSA